jgi:hypothetical protein
VRSRADPAFRIQWWRAMRRGGRDGHAGRSSQVHGGRIPSAG